MTFKEAAEFFKQKAREVQAAKLKLALVGAEIVLQEAKDELGTYQSAVGPFDQWPRLKEQTIQEKERLGFPEDPLIMTGELRDSLQIVPTDDSVLVGTDIAYAKYLELGTSKMPARSFVGRAGWVKQDEILEAQAQLLSTILKD